jgi:hypothetical protein
MLTTKKDEYNARYPENELLFIPSDEPWTWCIGENQSGRIQFNLQDFRRKWNIKPAREKGQPHPPAPGNWADDNKIDNIYA